MVAWRHEISLLVLKNIFQHSNRNFVLPRGDVISSMYLSINLPSFRRSTALSDEDDDAVDRRKLREG